MSKYDTLSKDEKILLFSKKNWEIRKIETEDQLKVFEWEKKGFDLIEEFLISKGGKENKYRETPEEKKILKELKLGSRVPFWGQYLSKNIQGTIYETKRTPCWDVYDWSKKKWSNFRGSCQYQNLSINLNPIIDDFSDFKISIFKLVKEENSFFSNKKFVQEIVLYPFLENCIHYKLNQFIDESEMEEYHYSLRREFWEEPMNFWKFIEKEDFNEYILDSTDIIFLKDLYKVLDNYVNELYREFIVQPREEKEKEKENTQSEIQKIILSEFDKNSDGRLDIIEGRNLLMDLLEKNQSIVVEFDHTLVQNIIKLNKFLNTKKDNLVRVFEILSNVETKNDLNNVLNVLRKGIENYESMLIHSLNMVISIKEKDLISYYEIYETFDELSVFNSNWENEVHNKLSNIDFKLGNMINSLNKLIISVNQMENSISSKINNLTYTTKNSFSKLENSLSTELKSIRSGIQLNNLLTGISTYQTYKVNTNTKSLKG